MAIGSSGFIGSPATCRLVRQECPGPREKSGVFALFLVVEGENEEKKGEITYAISHTHTPIHTIPCISQSLWKSSNMASFFARKPAVAPGDPTDRAVPLHFFESSLLVQNSNMAVSMVFDEVLDPEKLKMSLESLVKRDGWQRLGGRLRKNVRTL